MTPFRIDARTIGIGHPTFVIAEIGVNHDGQMARAHELVRIAAACGADAVKLQVFRATSLMHSSSQMALYQKEQLPDHQSPIDMLRKYELSAGDLRTIVREIQANKMIPLATPFSPSDMEVVVGLRVPAIKIASPDLVNRPLLHMAAQTGKPLIISTGAAEMSEVETSVKWLNSWNARFALLHCISAYPTPSAHANLCWINELAQRFNVPVGYSDHTTEVSTGAYAAAAGACIVERHITYDRNAEGPDHSASSDGHQFQRYVRMIREADVLRGGPGKRALDIEKDVRTVSRQSLVLRRSLVIGDVIREDDLTVQRAGAGMSAAEIERAVGKKVNKPLTAGTLLQWDMLDAA